MSFLRNPHLDLTLQKIETPRCLIVPFSTDGRVDIHELTREFCLANKNLWVAPILPSYEEELEFVMGCIEQMKRGEVFENYILEKGTNRLIGAIGLNTPEDHRMNLGLWIREDEQGKGYASEAYRALLDWSRENLRYEYLKHATNLENEPSRGLALKLGGILQEEKSDKGHIIYHIPL